MLELHVVRGASRKYDLLSLDPESLGTRSLQLCAVSELIRFAGPPVAASYLQLLKPGEWQVVPSDASSSPDGM